VKIWLQRYCLYFLIYNWPWLYYIGIKTTCCLVDHQWLPNRNNNEVHLIGRASFYKTDICVWAPNVHIIIFLKILPIQFYFGRWSPLLKFNQNCYSCFWETCHFVFQGSYEGSLISEPQCSDSTGTNKGWKTPKY
jgi:hypothetical protein